MSLAPLPPALDAPGTLAGKPLTASARLWRGLDAGLRAQPAAAHFVVLTVPAPILRLGAALHLFEDQSEQFVWAPDRGAAFVGAGDAVRIEANERCTETSSIEADIEARARELWPTVHHARHEEVAPFRLRLFGGLAFSPRSCGEPWQDLGQGVFVLPKWLYRRSQGKATLSLTIETPADRDELEQQIDTMVARLERGSEAAVHHLQLLMERDGSDTIVLEDTDRSHARWVDLITPLRDAIRRDDGLAKVVAARYGEVHLNGRFDLEAVLTRLGRGASTCTRFAFLRGQSIFFGATPERLVKKRGLDVETEALAGSIPKDASTGDVDVRTLSDRLFKSTKDLHEHRLVVQHIVDRLEPWCDELRVTPEPVVRVLRNVLHLETPIGGRLSTPRHVLELVARLHPTPAVGGVPVERAVEWIETVETLPRGWYAGPIGWFDEQGDGEFSVALRSCLLRDCRARVYAGAGIVDASDPELEWRETEVKQASVLEALGNRSY